MLRGVRAPGDRWTEHDRSLAVALTWWESTTCTGCGQPLEESTSEDADPHNRVGEWHYEVAPPTRCHACTAVAAARDAHGEAEHAGALRWHAVRVDHDDEAK